MDAGADDQVIAAANDPPTVVVRRNWTDWLQSGAHVAEIIGVIVVVTSLFFLSTQIQQNTTQLRRADLNATHDHWSAIRLFLAGDREHALFWSGALNGAELDTADQPRFNALMAEHARATFQIWDRNRSLPFSVDDFSRSAAPPLARLLCTAGGQPWWTQYRTEFPPEFVDEMDVALKTMLAGQGVSDLSHPCAFAEATEPATTRNDGSGAREN